MEILELNNISKSFGAIKALDNVTLSLRSGEVLGLMGDNGAGKSTLIKIIAGNFKQSSGTISFENQKVGLIVMVFRQICNLIPISFHRVLLQARTG